MNPKREKVEFVNVEGQTLAGLLESPAETHAYALFAHCFTCSKDIAAASRISRALARQGVAVLRFDFTGLGNSDGDFANTNFSSNVDDLVAAADHLRTHYRAPGLLIGHSLGGAAVLAAAHRIPESAAVVTIGAPANPEHVRRHFTRHEEEIQRTGVAEVTLAGRKFTIKKQFLEDITSQNLDQRIATLKKALLIFHAPLDNTVSIDEASRIYGKAKHPKSFISLDTADHFLSQKQDSEYVAASIAAWAPRYLPAPRSTAPQPLVTRAAAVKANTTRPAKGEVRVTEKEGFTQVIASQRHDWVADEPTAYGGADLGPNPYELLLASLGACTSMTMRMYANRKKLSLTAISVSLTHDRIHARDCETREPENGFIDRIQKRISLSGDLSDEQRQRILEIADRCPVHRTLHNKILIESRLA